MVPFADGDVDGLAEPVAEGDGVGVGDSGRLTDTDGGAEDERAGALVVGAGAEDVVRGTDEVVTGGPVGPLSGGGGNDRTGCPCRAVVM